VIPILQEAPSPEARGKTPEPHDMVQDDLSDKGKIITRSLKTAVPIDQSASQQPHIGMCTNELQATDDGRPCDHGVGIEEQNMFSFGTPEALVACAGKPQVVMVFH
jgi:hypothetical protein